MLKGIGTTEMKERNAGNTQAVYHRRLRSLYLFMIWIGFSTLAFAQQIPVKSRVNVHERVECDVYFKWGLLMPKAGQATISVNEGRYQAKPGYNYKLLFRTTGMFERIFKMRDTLESNFTQNFQLIKNQKRALEGNRYMIDNLSFTPMNNQTQVHSHRYSLRETKIDTVMYAKGIVLDMLSAILYLRSLDWNKMSSGDEFPITVPVGRDMVNVRFRYNGQAIVERGENVKYKTRHFYIDIYDEAFTQSKEAAEIWIGDDENHIPVRIRAKLKIGTAEVYYKSSSHLRYPLNSRVEIR